VGQQVFLITRKHPPAGSSIFCCVRFVPMRTYEGGKTKKRGVATLLNLRGRAAQARRSVQLF
jgi:hypothetical protein